jgi:hypothetical protein
MGHHAAAAGRDGVGEQSPRCGRSSEGLLQDQILPIEIKTRKGTVVVDPTCIRGQTPAWKGLPN